MKIQARYKIQQEDGIALGRKFWICGTVLEPLIGSIYTQEKDATDFTLMEIDSIKERFSSVIHVIE